VRAFFREPDFAEGDPEEYLRHLPTWVVRKQVAMTLWSHADWRLIRLIRLMVVDPARIAIATEHEPDVVLRVLEQGGQFTVLGAGVVV
jgi:hypothetical protein